MKIIISSILLIVSTQSIADIQVPATVLSSYKLPDVCERTGDFASTALGAVAGAAIGSQFGDGNGKDIMTATGAIVGANIAHSEKYNCYSQGFSTTIQFYDPYLGYTRNETIKTNYSYRNGHSLYHLVPEPYYPVQTYYTYPQYNKHYYSRPNNVIININKNHKHYKHHDRRDYRHDNRHDRRDDRHDNRHDRRDDRHDNRHDRRDDRHDNRHDRRDDRHDNRNDRKEQPVHKEEKRQWRQEVYKKDEN